MAAELIQPDWQAPATVRALVSTRLIGDVRREGAAKFRALLPAEPRWLKQVHGVGVVDASRNAGPVEADAAFTKDKGVVCTVMVADCMPVLLASEHAEKVQDLGVSRVACEQIAIKGCRFGELTTFVKSDSLLKHAAPPPGAISS